MDQWYASNVFSYELCVPFNQEKQMGSYMQADLNRFFGTEKGIEGSVEMKSLKSYVMIKMADSILKTNGYEENFSYSDSGVNLSNHFFSDVNWILKEKLEDMDVGKPFVDETGIDPRFKVDMKLTGDLKNVENLRKQLRQYGLDIIEAEREVEVLVIRDKKKE
jgi:hypothetical protein